MPASPDSHAPDLPAPSAETDPAAVVHLCIATEQVLANALPLRLLPWEHLVIVASDLQRRHPQSRLRQLLRCAEEGARERGLVPQDSVRVVDLPDTGMGWGDLLAFARRLAAQLTLDFPRHRLDVNITGGTKLMTQAFATAFGQARQVYCNTQRQALEVLDPQGLAPALALPPDLLDLDGYLHAQGYEVVAAQRPGDAAWMGGLERRRGLTLALVQEGQRLRMTPAPDNKRLLNLLHGMAASSLPARSGPGQGPRGFDPQASCRAPKTEVWCEVVAQLAAHGVAELVEWTGSDSAGSLVLRWTSEDAARYMAGGYLEEYAALSMLSLDIPQAQWAANVRLRPHDSHLPQGRDSQELDVAVAWRNRLWTLECKAGQQLHDADGKGQAILNKLDAIKVHVAGSLGEAWVLTPLPLKPDYHASILERAQHYGLRLVHGSQTLARLPALLGAALDVQPRAGSALQPMLFDLARALDAQARAARTAAHRRDA